MEPMVRLEHIEKKYGGVTALSNIDLSVEQHEFMTLLGPSGSGKTTLLNLVAGMVSPSSGAVFIRGRDVTAVPPSQRDLGMVFQGYALMPHMTVFENIAFPLRVRKFRESEIRKRVADVLELIRLPDIGRRKPRELSGGQQQRVSIARCLVYNPQLILMDEPLGALDRKLREQMQFEIKKLHDELKVTILYVTHDQEEAMVLSNRICLMSEGRIEQLGTQSDLYHRPASPFVATFLGEANLLEVELLEAGSPATVRGPGGTLMKAVVSEGPALHAGKVVNMLIRPERLRVLRPGESRDNEIEGLVRNVLFVGGTSVIYVELDGSGMVTSRQLTEMECSVLASGMRVRLGWAESDALLLSKAGR